MHCLYDLYEEVLSLSCLFIVFDQTAREELHDS